MPFLKNPFFRLFLVFIALLIVANQIASAQINYKGKLASIIDFNALKAKPLTQKYGNVEALKVVYDLNSEKLYFINSKHYKYHYTFCLNYLGIDEEHHNFNTSNYAAQHKNKHYLLANINHYKSDNLYALELSPVDHMNIEDIEMLFNKIKETSYFKNFKFFLHTSRLEKLKHQFTIPTFTANSLYKNQSYQPISTYKSYGKLRFIDIDSIKYQNISKFDIIVIDKPILELPITAGLITTNLQTPLSHISILGKNRKVPMAAYTKAMISNHLKSYNNQYVSFQVKLDTFYIKPISKKVFDKKTRRRIPSLISLEKDTSTDSLMDITYLNSKSVNLVGGKAANFSVLKKLSKKHNFKVPESAFAIPFYYYETHIKKSGADTLIKSLIEKYSTNSEPVDLDHELKSIQKRIKSTTLDASLILNVEDKIKSLGHHRRMRFRSSTNAEDILGFSGAGLYDSKTGIVGDSVKTIEKAIKKVWGSLWLERAFLERDYFNINQNSIAMGILVHRSFPSEKANGVAITKNLYRKNYFGTIINAQLGEEPVVNPNEKITCDQLICYSGSNSKLYDRNIVEVISYSSLNNGKLVLTESEIINLTKKLELIKRHYYYNKIYRSKKSYLDFALDVEFKIEGNSRDLYIKQARYFND
ncbi:MAG: PEP/pyruvate-binding domain-containing protein [Algibacter sp.]